MIHEYAVEPESLFSLERCKMVLDNCGIHKARLIAEFPGDWKKRAVESVRAFYSSVDGSEVKLKSAVDRLTGTRVKDKLIRRDRSYKADTKRWLDNALDQHKILPFSAILANEKVGDLEYVLPVDELGDNIPLWEVPTQKICRRKAAELCNCARMLLRISKEVLFVDAYFDPTERRFRNTLSHFLETARSEMKQVTRAEYHMLEPKYGISELQGYAGNLLPKEIPKSMSLTILVWQKRTPGDSIHARYILTERGGIGFDFGLDEALDFHEGESTDVRILDPAVYSARWRSLQRPTAEFDLLCEISIHGQR